MRSVFSGSYGFKRFVGSATVAAAATVIALAPAPAAQAALSVLSSQTEFSFSAASGFIGLPFTPGGTAGTSYNNIVFSLLAGGNSAAASGAGVGFLLSQSYGGTPTNLSSSTPGYLGSVTASGGSYAFSSALTLQAGTTYYFYQNGSATNYYTTSSGTYYGANNATSNYSNGTGVPRYSVSGSVAPAATAAPEPGSLALLTMAGLPMVGMVIRRRKVVTAAATS